MTTPLPGTVGHS